MKSKYLDLNYKVYSFVPSGVKILDIGCAEGVMGKKIAEEKHPKDLVGIEIDKGFAKTASKYYKKVLVLDLEKIKKLPCKLSYFDCIVLADVLEHLKNPEELLLLLKKYLNKEGVIIVSVPNVVFIINRIAILLGIFKYREKGIMDKSHLRFFTYKTIQELSIRNGFSIKLIEGYINTRLSLRFLNVFAKALPSLFAYQFVLVLEEEKSCD
jgi:2-polyprenyl-3-methyl-5-hydroxy-6-metoxy-1,4-benzoquinol methylase